MALNVVAPSTFQYVGRTEDGIPAIVAPDLGNGVISIPGNVSSSTLDDEYRRGYIQSYNFTVQRDWDGASRPRPDTSAPGTYGPC